MKTTEIREITDSCFIMPNVIHPWMNFISWIVIISRDRKNMLLFLQNEKRRRAREMQFRINPSRSYPASNDRWATFPVQTAINFRSPRSCVRRHLRERFCGHKIPRNLSIVTENWEKFLLRARHSKKLSSGYILRSLEIRDVYFFKSERKIYVRHKERK